MVDPNTCPPGRSRRRSTLTSTTLLATGVRTSDTWRMPGQRKRRQHTVAKTYLSGFANQQGVVAMYRRDGVASPVAIADATVRRDFYTFVDDRGEPNEAVEDWMAASVEHPSAGILGRVRSSSQLTREERGDLARFVAVSLLRTATVRSYFKQIDSHTRPWFVLAAAAKKAGYSLLDFPAPERQRLLTATAHALSSIETDNDSEQRSRLRTLLRKADEIQRTLATWYWRLDEATTDCLLTADAPVATLLSRPSAGWGGILPPDSVVALPVSPRRLLVASPVPLFVSRRRTS